MAKDTTPTRTKFIIFRGEVIALFPDMKQGSIKKLIACYTHVGQHGLACHSFMHCKAASCEQYSSLLSELESPPYEYNLAVMNKK